MGRRSRPDRKSTRLNSSHSSNSYAVFCLKKKKSKVFGNVGRGTPYTTACGLLKQPDKHKATSGERSGPAGRGVNEFSPCLSPFARNLAPYGDQDVSPRHYRRNRFKHLREPVLPSLRGRNP